MRRTLRTTTRAALGPSTPRIAAGGGAAYDTDAQTYITAVESADGQSLETGVKDAINAFVVGCKSDGIWTAIKASCILAGARTLSGALVPLVGTAPTNNNFVSGDYNRTAGLTGDGSTKYLNANRLQSADPQDNYHMAIVGTSIIGHSVAGTTAGVSLVGNGSIRSRNSTSDLISTSQATDKLTAFSRSAGASYTERSQNTSFTITRTSQAPASCDTFLFRNYTIYYAGNISFYSIGESLDLALLDSRVTTLITDIGTALA